VGPLKNFSAGGVFMLALSRVQDDRSAAAATHTRRQTTG
jgi:hypothetical protein